MQVVYCDKCKKKIKKDQDGYDNGSSIHFLGSHGIFDFRDNLHLCTECSKKINKIMKRFLKSKA